jgi:hypothetical protein
VGVDVIQTDSIEAHPELYRLAETSTMGTFENKEPVIKVVVDMIDGRSFASERDYAESMHEYPTRESIEEKFRLQCSAYGNIPPKNVEKLIALDRELENMQDMREYTTLLE